MDISRLRRKKRPEAAAQKDSIQTVLYVLLAFWVVMPLAFYVISKILRLIPDSSSELIARSFATRLLSADAKYFYILGIETICAAIWILFSTLPGGRNLLTAARRRPWHACLAFMLFWSVLSSLASGNPINCFWGLRYHNDGLASYFIYAAIYICVLLLDGDRRRLVLLRAFTIMGTLCSLMVYWQVLLPMARNLSAGSNGMAVFLNINHCGYYLTMSLLCAAGLWLYDPASDWRRLHLVSYVIQMYALILNRTFGCYVAVLLALPMICVFWFRSGKRELLRPLIPCAVFLLLTAANIFGVLPSSGRQGVADDFVKTTGDISTLMTNPEEGMRGGSGRIVIWVGALEQTAKHPLFGVGPDSSILPTPKSDIIRAHNEFLQHAMLLGLPALAAYLGAIFSLLAYRWKHLRDADGITLTAGGVVTGYLISSFFGITIFYTTPFFFFFLGLAAGRSAEETAECAEPINKSQREALAQASVLFVLFIFATLAGILYRESRLEYADYVKMRLAEAAGESAYMNGGSLDTRFWFDPANQTLYSADETPPEPYGRGTAINGKTIMTGEAAARNYMQDRDYRNAIILITAKSLTDDDTPETSAETSSAETTSSGTANAETANAETANAETTNAETANEETANAETANEETANAESSSAETASAESSNTEKKPLLRVPGIDFEVKVVWAHRSDT